VLVGWTIGVTVGLVAFALGSGRRGDLLSPGDLGFKHGSTRSLAPLAALPVTPGTQIEGTAGADPALATKSKTSHGKSLPAKKAPTAPAQERCGDCHVAKSGPMGLLAGAFGSPWGPTQSEL